MTMPSANTPMARPWLGLPDTQVGTLTQNLYDEAVSKNWSIISMKNDWKKILKFE